jgi:thymidine phosphorylase
MTPLSTSEVKSPSDGWVKRIDAGLVGEAAVDIGAGRRTKEDEVDPQVGIETCAIVGQEVKAGDVILRVFARSDEVANQAADRLQSALEITPQVVNPRELILE